ncbi:LysR family transcriptional regulator [Edaphobacillus lindanitolerans]|uniref:LysR family transcriptional regulator, repressor for citA n=1 Tax=Edaphobacillus lindanitolerans TaxID=550447 RepID=A0A1U7PLM2_9BACI|nr:LysR family transcriptional regulator [Edaphobacillus lindanitolerans]SIT88094.1 LysR family transcriptional regulator, repressor for citA [Edaphobacillus lindanitolerans]
MENQWLRTFCTAAEELNFRKAAERLLMSQPNVTVQIRSLEEALGTALFDRKNNRVSLTDAGRMFYPEARRLLMELDQSIQRVRSFSQGFRRSWNIGISPLMGGTVLPHILRAFMETHPDTEITIRVEESAAIEPLVEEGLVHLGISALPSRLKSVQSEKLYEDPVLFVMPQDVYDEESGPPIDPLEVLQAHRLFTHHHPVYWDALIPQLSRRVPGLRTMKVTQAHIAKRFVEEGLGVTFLPHSTIRRELTEGKLMQPHFDLVPLPVASTYALYRKKDELIEEFLGSVSRYYFG